MIEGLEKLLLFQVLLTITQSNKHFYKQLHVTICNATAQC
jgi:hypothetical protein